MSEYDMNSDGSNLNIGRATHGFDSGGADEYLKSIKTDLIDKILTTMDEKLPDIENGVHEVWVGQSADNFIYNVKDQISIVKDVLAAAFQLVTSTIYHAQKNMNTLDQELVTRREAGE